MLPRFLFLLLALTIFSHRPLPGQDLDVPKMYDAGVKAMESGKFDEGIASVDKVLQEYGATGKSRFGAVFGHFYYLKGMLLVKKKDYRKAIESFSTCARDFTNDPDEKLPNCFIAEALAQWAGCLMALQDYSAAANLYREALSLEETFLPHLNRLEAQVNLSKCLMLAGNSGQGKDFISKNLDDSKATDPMKRSLFLILMSDWSPGASLSEIDAYMTKYQKLLEGEDLAGRALKQNPVFLRLATDAIQAKDWDRAVYWYGKMVSPADAAKAIGSQVTALKEQAAKEKALPGAEAQAAQTEKTIATLQSDLDTLRVQQGDFLLGLGSANYAKGNLNEAIRCYLDFEKSYPSHPDRPLILHNLTICAINLSRWDVATRFGMQFFREYPNHELKPSMAQNLAEALYLQGNYPEANRIASQLVAEFKIGTPAADIPAFVAAAADFQQRRFVEAEAGLNDYLSHYPSGQRAEAVRFYLGAVKANLQKWDEAVAALDLFIKNDTKSELRPAALNLSAISYMMVKNFPMANSRLIELQTKHPSAPEVPNSYNLLGDIYTAREKPAQEIIETYQKALDMVEKLKRGDENVAGYALRQLIVTSSAAEQWDDAVRHYEHLISQYPNSTWRGDAVLSVVEPLVKTNRKEQAASILADLVNDAAGQADTAALDEAFAAYAAFLKNHEEPEAAILRVRRFPVATQPVSPALQAWLLMAEIDLLAAKKQTGDAPSPAPDLFQKLNQLYDEHGTKLSNEALVRIARFNIQSGGNPAQARKICEFILQERPGGAAAGQALADLAQMEAASGNAQNRNNAKNLFKRLLAEVEDSAAQEQATLGLARLEMLDANYAESRSWWEKYRSRPEWTSARAEASYQYGVCLCELGQRDEAAATFVNVYANFPGQLDWSTKAYIETAKIIRAKGNELDALKLLREMIQRMADLDHPGIAEGKELFLKWREEYTAKAK